MERAKTAVSRALRPILAAFAVVSLNAASPEVRGAQPGDELAQALRDNVVSIIAKWQNGLTHTGFGFIVGEEEDGQLYIATADHVVRGDLPDAIATTIEIEFHSRQGEKFPGKLLGTRDKRSDLAVLRVPRPRGLTWRKDVVSAKGAQRLMLVWYVGRAGLWYVPSSPGTVNDTDLHERIAIDDLELRVGTSGAPLVADSGIVGMVVSEESGITYATSIGFIEKAFRVWKHPWQLTPLETIARPQTALVVPSKPEVAVDPIEATYVTLKDANVREEPTVESAKVTTLKRGAEVHVAGKVKNKNWYLVERGDRTLGYVFGGLLLDVETARQQEEARRKESERKRAEAERKRAEAEARQQEEARRKEVERKRAEAEAREQEEARRREAERRRAEAEARQKEENARRKAEEEARRRTFKDCPQCPVMMVLPTGDFMMGSLDNEEGAFRDERPRHRVTISRPFAAGKYEVTFDQWDACVAGGGCNDRRPDDEGWGRGRRPVINVSWQDAKAYVAWLSRETGKAYRLLSEAEWEYAARAGTKTRYAFGDEISARDANFDRKVNKTTEVGSYPANSWGLHDMQGNVWEWTEDCGSESYEGAPTDGSAWTSWFCVTHILRGGSWNGNPWYLRSADRSRHATGLRNNSSGFRVARAL